MDTQITSLFLCLRVLVSGFIELKITLKEKERNRNFSLPFDNLAVYFARW